MAVFLLDEWMDERGRAVAPALSRRGYLAAINTLLVSGLLALALCWVWLRPATRKDARRFGRKALLFGSRRSYLWHIAGRATRAMPWLMLSIVGIGLACGVLLGGVRWWWLGMPVALVGASLAPAWAESSIHFFRRVR
jgi:hypothetical protein